MEVLARCPWCLKVHSSTVVYTELSDKRCVSVTTAREGLEHSKVCPKRPKRPYQCDICEHEPFTQMDKLRKHKAHQHNEYPEGHWNVYERQYACSKCNKLVDCGYKKCKFLDHEKRCTKGVPSRECPVCFKPIFENRKHKCTLGRITGTQHKRTYLQKLLMVDEFRTNEKLGPAQRALYLDKVGKQNINENLRR